jgi:hypothetical protein
MISMRSIPRCRLVVRAMVAAALGVAAIGLGRLPLVRGGAHAGEVPGSPARGHGSRGSSIYCGSRAPSAGWLVTLDEVRPSLDSATFPDHRAREPDPSYVHAQVIVTQDVLTTVETTTPISVYARVAPFVTKSKTATYRFLGEYGQHESSGAAPAEAKP